MSVTETTTLLLKKQDQGDANWHTALNASLDLIDAKLAARYAGDPNGNVEGFYTGQLCWDSTNKVLYLCKTAGNAASAVWKKVSGYYTIQLTFTGSGSEIADGTKARVRIPADGTIISSELVADQSGSIVIDLWKDSYSNYPPVDADSITASAPPTLSSAVKAQDATLTGWTKTLTEGQYLFGNVDSCTTITEAILTLIVARYQ